MSTAAAAPRGKRTAAPPADPALADAARRSRAARVQLAREDCSTFCEFVLRDEKTGSAIEQAPIHDGWHQLADENDRLVLVAHIESGKSQQMSIGRVLWTLGRDPSARICILSNTDRQAQKLVRTVRQYVERSAELHEVFPHLRRPPRRLQLPWGDTQFTIERPTIAKDPSVQGIGIHGAVVGSRLDLVVCDDIHDEENTSSVEQLDKLEAWWTASIVGRLVDGARVIVIGTPWTPKDLLHRLARNPAYKAVRYPVIDPDTGLPRWPEKWSLERIQAKATELGPLEAARQLHCVARDDASSKFKEAWIRVALDRGAKKRVAYGLRMVPAGYKTYTGVDLAVQETKKSDLTVLFTIIVHPDGTRELLWIESGRWAGPDIVARIEDTHRRYHSIVMVENNAAQDYIRQFTKNTSAVPILGFTTGRNKAHPEFGVESLAVEMAGGKWIVPCEGGLVPEIEAWITEMLTYDPKLHTGDRLMASWFAREAARSGGRKVETGRLDLLRR